MTVDRSIALPPFWSLVEEHGHELMVHARRLSGDAAEDVLQEALLRALRSYPRLRDDSHLRAWLYRVTTTTAFDHAGQRARRSEVLTEQPPEPAFYDAELDGFEDLIDGLSAGPREALRLRFVDDLSYEDIASKLGCSVDAARQRVSTAVRKMRANMKERHQ